MADERYQWLDQEAAERLLRGEPVDAVDDRARSRVERLAEALDAARTPTVPPAARTALPGEAAALAAFRKATAERAPVLTAATPGRTEHAELGRVRLAPVTAPRRRWGRSVRYGLAAAVAAVTVGGVAVAAGTGVLPIVGPAPASSVTAGETVDPLVSEEPGIRKDPEAPPTEPGGGDPTPGVSPSAGTTAPPTGGPDGHTTGTPGPGTPKPGRSTAGTGEGSGGKSGESGTTGATGDPGGTKTRERAVKACREFRSGKLDAIGRKRLTGTLRDGDTIRRYCDRILGTTGTSEGAGGKDGSTEQPKDDSDGDANRDDRSGDGRDRERDQAGQDDRRGDTGNSSTGNSRTSASRTAAGHARTDVKDRGTEPGSSARLSAALPLGIAVTARVPLPV